MKTRFLAMLVILGTALFAAGGAQAQADGTQAQADVSSGAARISLIHGQVSTQRGDSGDWAAAALNAPVVSGDKVSTGNDSRAEVQLDYADILRLSDSSQATIASLTQNDIQVQLGQGIANYDVFKNSEATAEIDTPNAAVHPAREDGSYRVALLPNGDTEVIVRKGEAEVSTPQGSTHVARGQMITVHGADPNTQYQIADAPPNDSWDRWNSDRDNVIQDAQAWNHTDRYYTGAQDLDAYGRWTNVPDYGSVWIPTADPGWVPYRDGRWVWEPYWGWTWVSYEPWGWAPYHYGRWFLYGSSWAWWPGPVYGYGYGYGRYRPIWAPAYVSFFGFGGGVGFGVGFGFGSVGWLPIGPCDRFYPWWGGYRNRYNLVSINNINGYRGGGFGPLHGGDRFSNLRLAEHDEHFRGNISTVEANRFGTGTVRARGLAPSEFHEGRFVTGNLPVVPTRASLHVSDRAASPSTIHGEASTHFYGRQSFARPASFEHEAGQVQSSIQHDSHFSPVRSDARGEVNANTRPNSFARPSPGTPVGANRSAESNAHTNAQPANNNWRRFGGSEAGARTQPGTQNQSAFHNNVPRPGQNSAAQGSRSSADQSWRHFGGSAEGARQPNNVPRPGHNSAAQSSRSSADQSWRHSGGPAEGGRQPNNVPRPGNNERPAVQDHPSGNWRQSTPEGRPESRPNDSPRNYSPRSEIYSGGGDRGYSQPSRSYSRPPLDMRQPVVRSSPSYSRPSGGGGSYHAERSSGGGGHASGGGQSHSSGGGGGGHHR
jgi:Family of unknown function (DUF6600)/FecR protein